MDATGLNLWYDLHLYWTVILIDYVRHCFNCPTWNATEKYPKNPVMKCDATEGYPLENLLTTATGMSVPYVTPLGCPWHWNTRKMRCPWNVLKWNAKIEIWWRTPVFCPWWVATGMHLSWVPWMHFNELFQNFPNLPGRF